MENCKVILSSKSLHRSLTKWEWHNWDDKGEGDITFTKNRMQFKNSEVYLEVENRGIGEFSYDRKKLKRLRKFCAAIQEQPITITFSNNDIEIHPPIYI